MQITTPKGPHGIIHIRSHNALFQVALLRHPPVSLPVGICYGRTDIALAPGWQSWAVARAAELRADAQRPWERVWSSPLSRCASVAAALGARMALLPVLDSRLTELDFGTWEGQAWADLPRDEIDRWAADPRHFSPPGGESGAALIARVSGFARMLIEEARSCIVVSHGGPLRLLPALLREQPPDLLAEAPATGALLRLRVVAPLVR